MSRGSFAHVATSTHSRRVDGRTENSARSAPALATQRSEHRFVEAARAIASAEPMTPAARAALEASLARRAARYAYFKRDGT